MFLADSEQTLVVPMNIMSIGYGVIRPVIEKNMSYWKDHKNE